MRGFEICTKYKECGVNIPKRTTKYSAGYDFELIEDLILAPGEVKPGLTGLKAFMNQDEVLLIYPRSSLTIGKIRLLKDGSKEECFVTLPNNVGVIDADYYGNDKNEGEIMILLHNFGKNIVHLEKGERVAQGIFINYLTVDNEKIVDTKRQGGFGSTD